MHSPLSIEEFFMGCEGLFAGGLVLDPFFYW